MVGPRGCAYGPRGCVGVCVCWCVVNNIVDDVYAEMKAAGTVQLMYVCMFGPRGVVVRPRGRVYVCGCMCMCECVCWCVVNDIVDDVYAEMKAAGTLQLMYVCMYVCLDHVAGWTHHVGVLIDHVGVCGCGCVCVCVVNDIVDDVYAEMKAAGTLQLMYVCMYVCVDHVGLWLHHVAGYEVHLVVFCA